jgi:hypothetical protein
MAKGPKGERRPADLNQRAFAIVRVASGEDADPAEAPRGQKAGKVGGSRRAAKLSPEERNAIAKRAAAARWGKRQ